MAGCSWPTRDERDPRACPPQMPRGPLDDKCIVHRGGAGRQAPNTRYTVHLTPRTQDVGKCLCEAWGMLVRTRLLAVVFLGIGASDRHRRRRGLRELPPGLRSAAEIVRELVQPAEDEEPALLASDALVGGQRLPGGPASALHGAVPR